MLDRGHPLGIEFPPPVSGTPAPIWTGDGFQIGDRKTAILAYGVGESGWTDELTSFHEDTAGSDHYIDCASRNHTLQQLRRWVQSDSPVLIDIGCSSGMMLDLLRREFPHATILGADYVRGPLEALAQTRADIPLLQFDLTSCPMPDGSFDGIVLLNVLEHIERDEAALAHVARILKPGGVAVIEVPAGAGLYDVYDKLLFHHRRYSMGELTVKAQRAGLEIVHKSHLGFFLYPPFWATKKWCRRYLKASEDVQKAVVARNITTAKSHPVMHKIMDLEAGLRRWLPYPFGIRCLLTCRRPATPRR
jgi:SAM-dependent methyltransferase